MSLPNDHLSIAGEYLEGASKSSDTTLADRFLIQARAHIEIAKEQTRRLELLIAAREREVARVACEAVEEEPET